MKNLIITTHEYLRIVKQPDILYCRADSCYTYIKLLSDEELLICKPLSTVSKDLHEHLFLRVNQSFLVNIDHISYLDRKNKLVYLTNRMAIPYTTSIKGIIEKLGRVNAAS